MSGTGPVFASANDSQTSSPTSPIWSTSSLRCSWRASTSSKGSASSPARRRSTHRVEKRRKRGTHRRAGPIPSAGYPRAAGNHQHGPPGRPATHLADRLLPLSGRLHGADLTPTSATRRAASVQPVTPEVAFLSRRRHGLGRPRLLRPSRDRSPSADGAASAHLRSSQVIPVDQPVCV